MLFYCFLLLFELQKISSMVNGIHRSGGNAVGIAVGDGPGLVQVGQGGACSGKVRGNCPENDIVRPLSGGGRSSFRSRHRVIVVKFKEIT